MPMPTYRVLCQEPGCGQPAAYKIAASWSDGVTQELKTYALSCAGCLGAHYRRCLEKPACRLAAGEALDAPGIYELSRGCRDVRLCRRDDLEN